MFVEFNGQERTMGQLQALLNEGGVEDSTRLPRGRTEQLLSADCRSSHVNRQVTLDSLRGERCL